MNSNHYATFVLSTGRCGTQWLHHAFEKYYGVKITVRHEPVGYLYYPRENLTHKSSKEFINHSSKSLKLHLDWVKEQISKKPYFETGHQTWSSMTYLNEIFNGKIRIIYITRNPLTLANSFLSLGFYEKPFLPHQIEKILLAPTDKGVRFPHYQQKWEGMSRFEKLLYYWLELNTHGAEFLENTSVPNIHIKFEDLFTENSLRKITSFLNLEFDPLMTNAVSNKIDNFNYMMSFNVDVGQVYNLPEVVQLAKRLNYSVDITV